MPNSPYTMEGMPESVSAAMRTTATNLFLEEVYSTMNIAANTPSGTAMSRDIPAMMRVLKSAGTRDLFSTVYSSSKSSGVRLGAPCMMTYTTIQHTTPTVASAESMTRIIMTNERGCLAYSLNLSRGERRLTKGLPTRSAAGFLRAGSFATEDFVISPSPCA